MSHLERDVCTTIVCVAHSWYVLLIIGIANTVQWEIFEGENFRGLVYRMAEKSRNS